VETRVQALLASVDDNVFGKFRPCDIYKLAKPLKLRRACRLYAIQNECLRHLPRRPLVHLTLLFNLWVRLPHFPKLWKDAKVINVPKPCKDTKFPQSLRPIDALSTIGQLLEKVILKIVQRQVEERGLLNASQFGFRVRHNTNLQCMRLTDHVTLNFNNNMFTTAVFLDIEKAFDTTWHLGLLLINYLN
jgi:hypothetical protein